MVLFPSSSMAFLVILLFVSILRSSVAASPDRLRSTSRSVLEIKKRLDSAGGCNANVCFALDGSGSISQEEYDMQKFFILDVVAAIAGNPLEVAAVQYGRRVTPISTLTSDIASFVLAVDASEPQFSRRTNIGRGIVWCHHQLLAVRDEALKIVVIGDGRNNARGRPGRRARKFRRHTGGEVCAVGIGYKNPRTLLMIAGRDPSRVLTVNDYFELTDILEDLVMMVCGIELL